MSDDQVRIPIEADEAERHRERCNQREQKMKAKFPRSEDPTSEPTFLQQHFWEKNSEILKLQKIVQSGKVDSLVDEKLSLSAMFDQVTPNGDSLLHVAASFGKAEIAELIGHQFPDLLTKTNIDGDTALHVAAKSGSSSVIKVILSQYITLAQTSISSSENDQHKQMITRLTNENGNTPLHEAVDSNHVEGVTLLLEADKCVAHYRNKSNKSPLYLAILSSNREILDILLEAPFPDDRPQNWHGNSLLHAVIYRKDPVLLREMVDKKLNLIYLKDELGAAPLHHAASMGSFECVRILLEKSSVAALERDKDGNFPIHLASKYGHVKVLQEFLGQDQYDYRVLLNEKGQNILHVATENGRIKMVNYILRHTGLTHLLINKKDKNGNTPLHLAAKNFKFIAILLLTNEKSINVNVMNNEGFTPVDIAFINTKTPITFKQEVSMHALKSAGAKGSEKTGNMHQTQKPSDVDIIKGGMKTLMLVTTLIVTVTFAAGFTIPGSVYSSDDPNPHIRGMAVLGHKALFKVFVVTDTIALYSSILGSLHLLAAQIRKNDLVEAYEVALLLLRLALLCMALAFMAATSLVTSNVAPLFAFSIGVGLYSLYTILVFVLPWSIPSLNSSLYCWSTKASLRLLNFASRARK